MGNEGMRGGWKRDVAKTSESSFVCCMRASEEAAVCRASASQELIPHHSRRGWHLGVSASKTN